MKKGTSGLIKFRTTLVQMRLEEWQLTGLLTSIWRITEENAYRGNIGRFSNAEIAAGIGYTGDADQMIAILTERRWLDADPVQRLIIHDWSEHCEHAVHKRIIRNVELFADGTLPDLSLLGRCGTPERDKFEKLYLEKHGRNSTEFHGIPQNSAPRAPAPAPSQAKPSQAKAPTNAGAPASAPTPAPTRAAPAPAHTREGEPAGAGGLGVLQTPANTDPAGAGGQPASDVRSACAELGHLAETLLGAACWGQWTYTASSAYVRSGGEIRDWHDLFTKIRDCRDDGIRRAKDLGPPIRDERAYFRHEATLLMEARALKPPPMREKRTETGPGATNGGQVACG